MVGEVVSLKNGRLCLIVGVLVHLGGLIVPLLFIVLHVVSILIFTIQQTILPLLT